MASLGALVIELAANTARLQSDLGKAVNMAQAAANRFSGVFRGVAALAGAGSLGAVVTKSIELGDTLNKAAIKAGITGKAMSELAYAAKLSDVDIGSLSNAIRKMQVALSQAGSGAKAPQEALTALGLSIQDVAGLGADQQFELIGHRISQLTDPADRARAATELFGRAGADLLPMFEQGAEGIRKAREEAQRMGQSFSGEQIKRLADADDAVKRLKASWEGFATSLTANVAPAIAGALDLLRGKSPGLSDDPLERRMNQLKKELSDLESFDPANVREGLRASSLERVNARIEAIRAEIKSLRTQSSTGRGGATGVWTPATGYDQTGDVDGADGLSQIVVSHKKLLTDYLRELDDMRHVISAEELGLVGAAEQRIVSDALQEADQWVQDLNDSMLDGIEGMNKSWTENLDQMSEYAKQAARNMQDALSDWLFDPFEDGLKGMLKGFIDTIRQMVAQAAAAEIFGSKKDGGLGLGDVISGLADSFFDSFGGGKAKGGPLQQGKWYVAGEHGPEPIWGGGAGAFAAGYGKGGGTTVNVTSSPYIDARGATREFADQLPGILQRHGESVKADIIEGIRRGKYPV